MRRNTLRLRPTIKKMAPQHSTQVQTVQQRVAYSTDSTKSNLPPGAFVEIYQRLYPVFNHGLSLTSEVHVNSTCTMLYAPYQHSLELMNGLIHPSWLSTLNPFASQATADAIILASSSERTIRYTNAYVVSHVNDHQELSTNNEFGSYTQQQIIKGHITFSQTQKLDKFIHEFRDQTFADDQAAKTWLANKIASDPLLQRWFSNAGYQYWSKCISVFSTLENAPTFDLELALLMCSPEVQKFDGGNLEAFFSDLVAISMQRRNPLNVLKALLNAFHSEVFHAYLAEGKLLLNRDTFQRCFGSDRDYWVACTYDDDKDQCSTKNNWFEYEFNKTRKDNIAYATNPILKKYVDEGLTDTDLHGIVSMTIGGLEVFCSPSVRQGYESDDYTLDDLKQLIRRFSDSANANPNSLLACFYAGRFTYQQLVRLENSDRLLFSTNWINKGIHARELQYDDIMWMYDQVYQSQSLTLRDIIKRSNKFLIYFNLYKIGVM